MSHRYKNAPYYLACNGDRKTIPGLFSRLTVVADNLVIIRESLKP